MVARQLVILFALLLNINTSVAIKGGKRGLRLLLQNTTGDVFDDIAPKEPPSVDDGNSTGPLGGVEDKKKEKKDKKDKKEKKCKKRDKDGTKKGAAKLSGEDPVDIIIVGDGDSDPSANETAPEIPDEQPPVPPVNASDGSIPPPPPDELILWCEDPSVKVMGDCDELEKDVFPGEESVDGTLDIEVTSMSDNLVPEMQRVLLGDTELASVGCGGRRLQGNETDANVTVYLLGVQLGKPSQSSENCTQSKDGNCTVVTSSVVIHYSGNATEDQKISMFDTLTNTILEQVQSGEFDSIASVHYAEAKMLSDSDGAYSSSKGSGPPVGIIGGIVGAIALIVLIIIGVVYIQRRNEDGCGPAAVVPTDRAVVQVLSDDVEVVRAHVFG